MNTTLAALTNAGVAVWLDDLSRDRLEDGSLARLVADLSVVGVTTNPSIFQAAITGSGRYDAQVRALADAGNNVDAVVRALTTDDVRAACDVLAPVAERTDHVDGRVSIEVDPRLAHDAEGTLAQAGELWAEIDRRNLLVKIPATRAGLPAIRAAVTDGISVNVTLIFSIERYRDVMEAYIGGLEARLASGDDISGVRSVASFFVSRVDTAVDPLLDAIGSDEALAVRGRAGVANARLAYTEYQKVFSGPRWDVLAEAGARPQRPLWASTGVKNPAYEDTMYVTELVGSGVVNTMPEATLLAVADHGTVTPGTLLAGDPDPAQVMVELAALGIDMDTIPESLEADGLAKFTQAWAELLSSVEDAMN